MSAALSSHFFNSEVLYYAAQAYGYSQALARCSQPAVWVPPPAGYGLHVLDGQSLSLDAQGGPALTTAPPIPGVYMVGATVGPSAPSGSTTWLPNGTDALQPLIGVNMFDGVVGKTSPSPTTIHYEGEASGATGTYLARRLQLAGRSRPTDPAHQEIVVATGIAGQPIEVLLQGSAGTPAGAWSRTLAGCDAASALAGAGNLALLSFTWIQGEANYSQVPYTTATGATAIANGTRAGYRAQLERLNTAVVNEILVGRLGGLASAPPPFMVHQTAARTTTADALGLGVSMAQLDFSLAHPNTNLYGSIAPYPDNGVHGTSNAYRWLDSQRGKVLNHVRQGHAWHPLMPLSVVARGTSILITYHVPVGHLQFGTPYSGLVTWSSPDMGFTVLDNAGAVGVVDVTIPMGNVVMLTTSRAVSVLGDGLVRYADGAHGGLGCLHDSDPTMSDVPYVYVPGMMFPGENIAALVGKPMPLVNWSVAFQQAVTAG